MSVAEAMVRRRGLGLESHSSVLWLLTDITRIGDWSQKGVMQISYEVTNESGRSCLIRMRRVWQAHILL